MATATARGPQPRRPASPDLRDPDADRMFVEEMAMLLELYSRYPRTAGRIYALLLISDEPSLSQQEITERLDVSQASVSTMTRRLVDDRLIERMRPPGSRRDHYRLRRQGWSAIVRDAAEVARRFVELMDRALTLRGPQVGPGRQQISEVRAVYERLGDWLEREAAES